MTRLRRVVVNPPSASARPSLVLLLLVAVMLTMIMVRPSVAKADDEPVTERVLTLQGTPEPDGKPVPLDVTVLSTQSDQPRPAIVLAHGFGGTKADMAGIGASLARQGYVVVTYTARGFGRSGGRIHLNNPTYEGADAKEIIDLVAADPGVLKDGTDPVVGFAGASYGGSISLLAAALDPRIDAIAPAFTWNSLTQALFPQYATSKAPTSPADVASIGQPGVFKQRWAALFFLSGGGAGGGGSGDQDQEPQAGLCGRFSAGLCQGYTQAATTGQPTGELIKLLDGSSMQAQLAKITAPTLLVQGEQDTLFPLDHADANLRGLPQSTPAKMEWVAGGHDSKIDIDKLLPDLTSWFDRYLKRDGTPVDTTFDYVVPQTSLVGQDDHDHAPKEIIASGYPGRATALETQRRTLAGKKQTMISPPGGSPAALTNLPGTGGVLSTLSSVGGYPLGVLPGQSTTFETPPQDSPLTMVGGGSVTVWLTSSVPQATLFASLWDLGPDTDGTPGTAVLPQLAVSPVKLSGLIPGVATKVDIALPPVVHQVPVGHRLQLVISSTDQAYAVPTTSAVYQVSLVGNGTLTLPFVPGTSLNASRLDVPLPLLIVVSALVLAAIAALIALWLGQRRAHPREDLRQTPLLVEDLVKTYGDGFRAVDGISFAAHTSQVVGLLGPNGAGKTTTMRMLVGLIRPDSGAVFVAGEPVHAGADVLGSVGAFIEGPGFLPHLSGMQNLTAFWRATGRPSEDAHLEEALEIAGLGSAIDRLVRGYSHGMRQRLGIAQAMLGLPELLLLDEPTNGLDPPQIKAMRSVLTNYSATGRTVVVSSHLLSEVEQTCSHVVVMDKGKVILEGAIDDLTATDDVTMIGLGANSDRAAAIAVLEELGLTAANEGKMIKVHGAVPRARVVATLVERGFDIDEVDGHRQLEEVFMSLVGTAATQQKGSDV